jgi:peptide/nickel transport system substrate-binding protein
MTGRVVLATLATGLALLAAGCGKSADEVEGDSSAAPPATSAAAPESSAAASSEAATGESAASSEAGSDTAAASAPESSASEPETAEAVTTPAPTGPVDDVVWAVYRETNSLDPIYAFDYPENTVVPVLCDALLRQQPDGTIAPGLATDINVDDPLNMVITLRDGVTFWDGTPLTAEDVVFSLERNRQADLGGFYGAALSRVDTITATGPNEVTLKMKEPDAWLRGELSGMLGIVVQKKYAEAQGAKFGTVDGGTMCTGPFKLDSWKTGEGVTVVKNDAYWDTSLVPQASKITFKGVPDDANITSGLLTGELTGIYPVQLTTLDQLRQSDEVNVYEGPSYASDALIVSNFDGPLGDVKVRQALSMAIDRQGLIDTVYKGAGIIPHALGNPGSWGYAPDVFQAGWDALPELTQDLEGAKALIQEAGAAGKTIRLGTSSELPALHTEATAVKSAAESIGLKVELESTSAANYINFFIDPKARENVDGFFTVNYPDYADPAGLYGTLVLPDGSQNYSGYANEEVTRLMNEARSEFDDATRAQKVVDAQKIITDELPWIPVVSPTSVLVMNKGVTGAPTSFQYMFGPWAASLGAAG